MKYFDIIGMKEGADPALVSRLGFSKVFSIGRELELRASPVRSGKKQIVSSKEVGTLMKAAREQDVVGIAFEDNEIVNKAIAAAKEAGKPIIVDMSGIFAAQIHDRYRNIGRIRGLLKAVAIAKADVVLVSGAKSVHYLLSPNQIIEIAKFLGQGEEKTRRAMSKIGEYVDS